MNQKLVLLICTTISSTFLLYVYSLYNENKVPSYFNLVIGSRESENKTRIFCIILTTRKNLETKARLTYEAWASKCDNHTFVSLIPDQEPSTKRIEIKYKNVFNLLKPEGFIADTYANLTFKTYSAFKDAYLNNYNYDWFLKADDDTFIFDDNLRLFLSEKNSSAPVSFGYHFRMSGGYLSGGGGYLLSKESLNRLGNQLISNETFCPMTGIEDVDIGECLRNLGVHPSNSTDEKCRERFHVTTLANHFENKNNVMNWLNSYAANPLKTVIPFSISK